MEKQLREVCNDGHAMKMGYFCCPTISCLDRLNTDCASGEMWKYRSFGLNQILLGITFPNGLWCSTWITWEVNKQSVGMYYKKCRRHKHPSMPHSSLYDTTYMNSSSSWPLDGYNFFERGNSGLHRRKRLHVVARQTRSFPVHALYGCEAAVDHQLEGSQELIAGVLMGYKQIHENER